MTKHQRAILIMLESGRTYAQVCKSMGITPQSLYTTTWRMRQKGIEIKKKKAKLSLTPTQRTVLTFYLSHVPPEKIAKSLHITTQTVINHAWEGFKRLGLTTPGVDRIEALRAILEPKPITIDDPFFN